MIRVSKYLSCFNSSGVNCSSEVELGTVSVTCEANSPLEMPSECNLSGSNRDITFPCKTYSTFPLDILLSLFWIGNASDIVIGVRDFPLGDYNLTVTVRDENGQTAM